MVYYEANCGYHVSEKNISFLNETMVLHDIVARCVRHQIVINKQKKNSKSRQKLNRKKIVIKDIQIIKKIFFLR